MAYSINVLLQLSLSNKKLLVTSASLLITSALLVTRTLLVTRGLNTLYSLTMEGTEAKAFHFIPDDGWLAPKNVFEADVDPVGDCCFVGCCVVSAGFSLTSKTSKQREVFIFPRS